MNKIITQLKKLKDQNRIGLMTHVVVGYPSLESTISLIQTLADAGSDFIELQIPFSDPIADGPTIMRACDIALQKGVTVQDCLEVMKQASEIVSVPLLFMGYYNSVLQYGVERFCRVSRLVGASGLIIPDMPPNEEKHEHFFKYTKACGLSQIRVVTPASSIDRLKANALFADGFVYCVSHYGITGSSTYIDQEFGAYIKRVKKYFKLPVAVGFGISSRKDVQMVEKYADIVVVGTAVLDIINRQTQFELACNEVGNFIKSLFKHPL